MSYLLVTHIAFRRAVDNSVMLDNLWALDLKGLVSAVGPVTVAAPELPPGAASNGWGPGISCLTAADRIRFVSLPVQKRLSSPSIVLRTRAILRREVERADLVHSSNLFPPNLGLWYAHDLAVQLTKKTLFVVAEDFHDMLSWEWVRTAGNPLQRWRRRRTLSNLDLAVRKRVGNASLTFLHTPAAVMRYRLHSANAVAIRQAVHEEEDVISEQRLSEKCEGLRRGDPLTLVTASRLAPLKGIEFMLRAMALLMHRGGSARARIYGAGLESERLKKLACSLQLGGRVEFLGPVPPGPELREALASGHLFLMPHLTTDFGRAFFDGMAAGAPVIAFRSPASEDTVRDGVDGLLTPNADFEGLAEGISRFDTDRDWMIRAAHAARNRALLNTRTSWNKLRAGLISELLQ